MFALTVTDLKCPSINYYNTGRHLSLSLTLPSLSGLCSFICNLLPTLKSESFHCVTLFVRIIPLQSGIRGPLQLSARSTKCKMPFSGILAYGGTTIVNFLCSILIFQPRELAVLHASLQTMMPPLMLCTNVCKEVALISIQRNPLLCFTQLLLDAAVRARTKSAFIDIWKRHSWATTPSINAVTWPSANGLSG
jgi:hypothetical protein